MPSRPLDPFKNWLCSKSYSSTTIRNYLADVNKYLDQLPTLDRLFDETALSTYLNQLTNSPTEAGKNYARRALASLSKFCQFAIDQRLITTNPISKINHQSASQTASTAGRSFHSLDDLLSSFKTYLLNHHKSESTITNYINDCQQFINFCLNKN